MSPDTIELRQGDPCPVCGGAFAPARRLSPEEYRRIYDKENPQPVPPLTDTLAPDLVEDLGALFLCTRCDYKTRFPVDATTDRGRARDAGASDRLRDQIDRDARRGRDQDELEAARRRIRELEAERARSQAPPSA